MNGAKLGKELLESIRDSEKGEISNVQLLPGCIDGMGYALDIET
jgi:hypothetical protein